MRRDELKIEAEAVVGEIGAWLARRPRGIAVVTAAGAVCGSITVLAEWPDDDRMIRRADVDVEVLRLVTRQARKNGA